MTDEGSSVVPQTDPVTKIIREAEAQRSLLKGLHEVTKAIESKRAILVFLAEDCDEQNYVKLVEGLCREKKIDLVMVPSKRDLGIACGLHKIDKNALPRREVNTSSVAITCDIIKLAASVQADIKNLKVAK